MKNLKKLTKKELLIIKAGSAPRCCIDWDPIKRKCSLWDPNCV